MKNKTANITMTYNQQKICNSLAYIQIRVWFQSVILDCKEKLLLNVSWSSLGIGKLLQGYMLYLQLCNLGLIGILCRAAWDRTVIQPELPPFSISIFKKEALGDSLQANIKIQDVAGHWHSKWPPVVPFCVTNPSCSKFQSRKRTVLGCSHFILFFKVFVKI